MLYIYLICNHHINHEIINPPNGRLTTTNNKFCRSGIPFGPMTPPPTVELTVCTLPGLASRDAMAHRRMLRGLTKPVASSRAHG
jgi:hypothetical protein